MHACRATRKHVVLCSTQHTYSVYACKRAICTIHACRTAHKHVQCMLAMRHVSMHTCHMTHKHVLRCCMNTCAVCLRTLWNNVCVRCVSMTFYVVGTHALFTMLKTLVKQLWWCPLVVSAFFKRRVCQLSAILCWKYWIPFELQSQTAQGPTSTGVGDCLGISWGADNLFSMWKLKVDRVVEVFFPATCGAVRRKNIFWLRDLASLRRSLRS